MNRLTRATALGVVLRMPALASADDPGAGHVELAVPSGTAEPAAIVT